MTLFGRRPHAILLAAALSCVAFSLSVTPIAVASLALAAERQDVRVATMPSPLYSPLVATILLIGGCAGAFALSQRHRLVPQRPDSIVIPNGTPTAPPNAGSVWGVGN